MTFPSAKTTFSLRKKKKSVMIQHPLIDFDRKKSEYLHFILL